MAHDPILEERTLTPSPLRRGRVDIPIGAVGVLYGNGRYIRTLEPGDSLSFKEKTKTLTLYIVDTKTHRAVWNVLLPTSNDEDRFPVSITFDYRVVNPQHIVENHIRDTELAISRMLEPVLRRETRGIALNQYRKAESVLEDTIRSEFYRQDLGLEFIQADVTMNLDEATRERIRQMDDLERAVRVPQLCEHTTRLPSKEPTYGFETQVAITYQVSNLERLPTRTLEEAEEWLWRQVQRALRRVSRRYKVDQVDQAEEAMQEAVEADVFSDHGLEVVSAVVEISLDDKAAQRAQTLTEIRTQEEIERAKANLENWQRKRELDQQRDAIDFYAPLIREGQWTLLAMILSQDPSSAQSILDRLDAQRREALANQMTIFQSMVEAGGLEGWQMEDQAKIILQSVMNQTMSPSLQPGLPSGQDLKPLPADESTAAPDDGDQETVIDSREPTTSAAATDTEE